MSRHLGHLLIIVGVCWSVHPAGARAGERAVVDDAKMFLPSTLRRAAAIVDTINRDYHQRVLVETFARLPADKAAEYRGQTRHEQQHFFERWAAERGRAGEGADLYLLICRDPARVRVVAARSEEDRPLNEAQRMEVRKVLEDAFEKKRYDDGLLRGLERVDELLLANARAPQSRWGTFWPWVLGLGATAFAFWLILRSQRLLRRKLAAMGPNSQNDIGEPGVGVDMEPGQTAEFDHSAEANQTIL
jgi:hypothetical protein